MNQERELELLARCNELAESEAKAWAKVSGLRIELNEVYRLRRSLEGEQANHAATYKEMKKWERKFADLHFYVHSLRRTEENARKSSGGWSGVWREIKEGWARICERAR